MYINHLKLILPVAACMLAGCNNDIFVDDPVPSATDVVVEGDGGEVIVTFQPKGLEWIGFDYTSTPFGTYYDDAGEEISWDSPAREVARISYTSAGKTIDVYIKGNKLTIHSTEYADNISWHASLRLDYGYSVQFIDITILPGEPLEFVSAIYDDNMAVSEQKQYGESFINDGNISQTVEIRPYLTTQAAVKIEPTELWARYIDVNMPLPSFTDGKWQCGSERRIRLNTTLYYMPPALDRIETVDVTVPPHSRMTYWVNISNVKISGKITMRAPVSGREYTTDFNCEATEPISYDIQIDKIN